MNKKLNVVSKEIKDVFKALENYLKKHNGDIYLNVQLGAFNKENLIIDDINFLYGGKKTLLISNEAIHSLIDENKEDFINHFLE